MPAAPTYPDPNAPAAGRARRRRLWRRLALGTALALGSSAGGVAGCAVWLLNGEIAGDARAIAVSKALDEALRWAGLLPEGELARDARAGGVGEALDEALRQGDAEPLGDYLRRVPGTRVCFVWQYDSLSGPPWRAYWRTYGLPNLAVPDGAWAIVALRAGRPPEFAVAPPQRLILSGNFGCADAERLRLRLDTYGRPPSVLRMSAEP